LKAPEKNLLIVEDDLLIGERIFDATTDLQKFKKVQLSTNLEEAKSNLVVEKFDMIILDLNLPDGSGINLLKWLSEKQMQSKVFIFSASKELKRICLKNGAHSFFDKAQDFDELIYTLKTCNS
jgi:response regulator of citrate/malate metabolism